MSSRHSLFRADFHRHVQPRPGSHGRRHHCMDLGYAIGKGGEQSCLSGGRPPRNAPGPPQRLAGAQIVHNTTFRQCNMVLAAACPRRRRQRDENLCFAVTKLETLAVKGLLGADSKRRSASRPLQQVFCRCMDCRLRLRVKRSVQKQHPRHSFELGAIFRLFVGFGRVLGGAPVGEQLAQWRLRARPSPFVVDAGGRIGKHRAAGFHKRANLSGLGIAQDGYTRENEALNAFKGTRAQFG